MPDLSKDMVDILFQLLPGFLAAAIFYTLTAHPKGNSFERVIQALIFTAIIKVVVVCVQQTMYFLGAGLQWRGHSLSFGEWTSNTTLVWSFPLAVVIGVLMSRNVHKPGRVYRWMQKWSYSRRTASPSQWYSAFHKYPREVILTITGERRLQGFPEEWPDEPEKGHFLICTPSWILDDGQPVRITQSARILIPAKDVSLVEFVAYTSEVQETEAQIVSKQAALIELLRKDAESRSKTGVNTTSDPPNSLPTSTSVVASQVE